MLVLHDDAKREYAYGPAQGLLADQSPLELHPLVQLLYGGGHGPIGSERSVILT
jgi:hypothetical protein